MKITGVRAFVTESQQKPFDPKSITGLCTSQWNSLKATARMVLKAHATRIATGKNTMLLGMLDEIEVEM